MPSSACFIVQHNTSKGAGLSARYTDPRVGDRKLHLVKRVIPWQVRMSGGQLEVNAMLLRLEPLTLDCGSLALQLRPHPFEEEGSERPQKRAGDALLRAHCHPGAAPVALPQKGPRER